MRPGPKHDRPSAPSEEVGGKSPLEEGVKRERKGGS